MNGDFAMMIVRLADFLARDCECICCGTLGWGMKVDRNRNAVCSQCAQDLPGRLAICEDGGELTLADEDGKLSRL